MTMLPFLAGELDGLRAASESAMLDVGTITRPAAGGTLDPADDRWTPAASTTVYAGAMRVRTPSLTDLDTLFGDQEVTRHRYVLTVPATVPEILSDDRVNLSTSSDPELPTDRSFRVIVVGYGSNLVDRRAGLELVE